MHARWRSKNRSRGQTALEYAMVVAAIIIPTAIVLNLLIGKSFGKEERKQNAMRIIVSDSYGDENHLGVIGRPYP